MLGKEVFYFHCLVVYADSWELAAFEVPMVLHGRPGGHSGVLGKTGIDV